MLDGPTLVTALEAGWGWASVAVTPLDTGMNSRTWWVDHGDARDVAKWVPVTGVDHLLAGVAAAGYAARAGSR